MIKVMFVCHGNICRSPMAEFIFKNIVKQLGLERDFYICSSATSTEEIINGIGRPVYPPARRELESHGIDCSGKQAVQLQKSDYDHYDWLLGMDSMNMKNMEKITGHQQGGKMVKLLSFTDDGGDIADPWYYGNFDKTYTDIVRGCEAFLNCLKIKGLI